MVYWYAALADNDTLASDSFLYYFYFFYIGQTGALRHGISKALLPLSEAFQEKLIEGVYSGDLEIKYVSTVPYYNIIVIFLSQ